MTGVARLLALAAVAALGALALDGAQAFGRLALRAGLPEAAAPLLRDPHLRGRALLGARDWAGAAAAFNRAGPTATYDRAGAVLLAGDPHAALLAYDAVLARDPTDVEAAENRAIAAALEVGPEGMILPGDLAAGQGGGPDDATSPLDKAVGSDQSAPKTETLARADFAPQIALAREQVRRMPDARGAVANRLWLEGFADEPGDYIRAAIAAEHARRRQIGATPPEPLSPW
jgi:Ca-activated chloride channel family protein